jgi:RNA polymerase sigma-70 factor (sigma-E family)
MKPNGARIPPARGDQVAKGTTMIGDPVRPRELDVGQFFASQWRSSVRLAVLLVDDRPSAEDVVQDAFVSLHRHRDGLEDEAAALRYLRATIVYRSRSVIRRRQTVRRHLKVAEPQIGDGADYEVLLSAEHHETLLAVRRLPRAQREVVVLRYWAQLSEAQIAAVLGISKGTVKSHASRGLAALRASLGGQL